MENRSLYSAMYNLDCIRILTAMEKAFNGGVPQVLDLLL